MQTWVDSQEFRNVVNACRANDRNTLNSIIEERLSTVCGAERAFWLRLRAGERARDSFMPHLLEKAWADLEESLRLASDDPEQKLDTVTWAIGLSLTGERLDRVLPLLKAVRPHISDLKAVPLFWQNLGFLNMKRARWHKATRAFDHAIDAFGRMTPNEQEMFACRRAHFYGWRAICQVARGHLECAARDIQLALVLAEAHPPRNINHSVLGMARAELALEHGLLQEARSALQHGIMQDFQLKRPKAEPAHVAERELLAARIARAEGNIVGFGHFCDKALAICTEYRLPLTEERVRAVMAGAVR